MDDFAKFLSLAAAGSVICSAAFLFEQLFGLGHVGLVWYLTFSDFVNYAPGTLLVWGLVMIGWIFNDAHLRSAFRNHGTTDKSKQRRNLFVVLIAFGALAIGVALLVAFHIWPLRVVLTLGSIGLILVLVNVQTQPFIVKAYGQLFADGVDTFMTMVMSAIVFGYFVGAQATDGTAISTICTEVGARSAKFVMPMDRGMVLIGNSYFQIIPWSNVRSAVVRFDAVSTEKENGRILKNAAPSDVCAETVSP